MRWVLNEKGRGLAALFHDVGHCIYSHVSERAISALTGIEGVYPSVNEIGDAFTKALNRKEERSNNWLTLEESDFEREDARPGYNTGSTDLFSGKFDTADELGFIAIRKRQLLHRAFAFGVRNSLSDVLHDDHTLDETPATLKFFEWVRENEKLFIAQITGEVNRICKLLDAELTEGSLTNLVIDVPNHRRVQQGQESVFLERPIMLPLRWTLPLDQIRAVLRKKSGSGLRLRSSRYLRLRIIGLRGG